MVPHTRKRKRTDFVVKRSDKIPPIQMSILKATREIIGSKIETSASHLHDLNKSLHAHPETAYQEHFAHDTITSFLEAEDFEVERHAYGLDTSFEASYGTGGRLVIICAEYDALPGIGHACGHNLIATSSVAAFIATVAAIKEHGIQGRVQILGTPAEEGGGGKAKLIDGGAFPEDTAGAIMAHPASARQVGQRDGEYDGLAGFKLTASHKFKTIFHGRPAHAAAQPWNGVNALDAAVAAYNNVSMLRQQINPDERVTAIIEEGGKAANVIPGLSSMSWNVRAPTITRANELLERVTRCVVAGAFAAGCEIECVPYVSYSFTSLYLITDEKGIQLTNKYEPPRQLHTVSNIRR